MVVQVKLAETRPPPSSSSIKKPTEGRCVWRRSWCYTGIAISLIALCFAFNNWELGSFDFAASSSSSSSSTEKWNHNYTAKTKITNDSINSSSIINNTSSVWKTKKVNDTANTATATTTDRTRNNHTDDTDDNIDGPIPILTSSTITKEIPPITFLVQLSGEFGNNLQKIIRGWGTAKLAYEEFGIKTHIVFAEQRKGKKVIGKAKATTKFVQLCFLSPYFKGADFKLGNRLLSNGYFHELDANIIPNDFSLSEDDFTIHDIRDNLKKLSDYLHANPQIHNSSITTGPFISEREGYNSTMTASTSTDKSIPKVMVRIASLKEVPIMNEFYDTIRETFVFDDAKCCGETLNAPPYEDESVLHYRNFATEMKLGNRKRKGFEELDPTRLASEVFGHLKPGDKIAITGRNLKKDSMKNSTDAYKLVRALEGRNLTIRFGPGKSAMEDFCFLKSAKKELVGTYKSSYVKYAAYLGGPSIKVSRLYQYSTPQAMKAGGSLTTHQKLWGNWTNPELASRIKFEEYF